LNLKFTLNVQLGCIDSYNFDNALTKSVYAIHTYFKRNAIVTVDDFTTLFLFDHVLFLFLFLFFNRVCSRLVEKILEHEDLNLLACYFQHVRDVNEKDIVKSLNKLLP